MRDKTILTAALFGLVACSAQTGPTQDFGPDAGQIARSDAAAPQPQPQPTTPSDAGMPTPPSDACVPQVTQLLVNPTLDQAPQGKGWTQTLAAVGYPLITSEDGVAEQSAPYKVWLGGLESTSGTINDSLVQEIVIPPLTTHLVLTGYHDVRTAEAASTTAFDTAKIVITEPNGTTLATALTLSNVAPTTAWTMFGHAFTQDLSGRTVRIRLRSSNDNLDPTSFFFDSLALTATHGCPPLN